MPLSDLKIKQLKSRDKAYKVFDGGGLFLMIYPSNKKVWKFKYRFDGREQGITYGEYPAVSLKDARGFRDRDKGIIAAEKNPSEEKKLRQLERLRERESAFEIVANAYYDKEASSNLAEATLSKKRWLLDIAINEFRDKPVHKISVPEIHDLLQRVSKTGAHEKAKRLRTAISAVFRYAIQTGLTENNPADHLRGSLIQSQVKSRSAIVNIDDLRDLYAKIDTYTGRRETTYALRLLVILFPRPSELTGAEWKEFDFDQQTWLKPAEKTKARREHLVPLPKLAIFLLRRLQEFTGDSIFLFPSTHSFHRPMSNNTLNKALRIMGYAGAVTTAHGFRSSFSTIANESGMWNPDAIERALDHLDQNQVRKAYDRSLHWNERVKMAEWWSRLVAGGNSNN